MTNNLRKSGIALKLIAFSHLQLHLLDLPYLSCGSIQSNHG